MAMLSISNEELRRISSGRWFVPLLAVMHSEQGSRFGALARRLEMPRSTLSRHLDELTRFGWTVPNAGHGHPLRPEYLLTPRGREIAGWAQQVMEQRARLGLERHDLGRWSMPLLVELNGPWQRFSPLQKRLAPISPRALSLTLKQLLEVDLVGRRLEERFPPFPLYGLTERGRKLVLTLT